MIKKLIIIKYYLFLFIFFGIFNAGYAVKATLMILHASNHSTTGLEIIPKDCIRVISDYIDKNYFSDILGLSSHQVNELITIHNAIPKNFINTHPAGINNITLISTWLIRGTPGHEIPPNYTLKQEAGYRNKPGILYMEGRLILPTKDSVLNQSFKDIRIAMDAAPISTNHPYANFNVGLQTLAKPDGYFFPISPSEAKFLLKVNRGYLHCEATPGSEEPTLANLIFRNKGSHHTIIPMHNHAGVFLVPGLPLHTSLQQADEEYGMHKLDATNDFPAQGHKFLITTGDNAISHGISLTLLPRPLSNEVGEMARLPDGSLAIKWQIDRNIFECHPTP